MINCLPYLISHRQEIIDIILKKKINRKRQSYYHPIKNRKTKNKKEVNLLTNKKK